MFPTNLVSIVVLFFLLARYFSFSSKKKSKKKIRRIIDDAELGKDTRRKIAIEKVLTSSAVIFVILVYKLRFFVIIALIWFLYFCRNGRSVLGPCSILPDTKQLALWET